MKKTRKYERNGNIFESGSSGKEMKGEIIPHCKALKIKGYGWSQNRHLRSLFKGLWASLANSCSENIEEAPEEERSTRV